MFNLDAVTPKTVPIQFTVYWVDWNLYVDLQCFMNKATILHQYKSKKTTQLHK